MITLRETFKIDGTLTDVTSVKLSDPTGTFGVKRNDTDAVVVADDASMTKSSTGVYEYEFEEPSSGLTYTYYVEWVYGGETYRDEKTVTGSISSDSEFTFSDLKSEVGYFLGYGSDSAEWSTSKAAEIEKYVQSGVRQFYYPPAIEGVEPGFRWSWLTPVTTLATSGSYSTGTIAIANGSTTVTLSDGTWPSWAASNGTLVIDSTEYTISSRDSDTELTLSSAWSADSISGESYSLNRDSAYDLPDDFGQIAGSITFAADSGYAPITVINEGLLRAMQADSDLSGRPKYAAIRFKASDGSDGQRQELLLYPTPDAVYTLTYKYEAYNGKLTDANPYPLGGMACSELALESCLSIAEQRSEDKKGVHWDNFARLLVSAIARDRKNGAKYFGPMGHTSEYTEATRTRATSEITYKGETW